MAEGWARRLGADRFEVRSAGIEAHGKNHRAIAVMQEVGVDISQQKSTPLDPKLLEWADLVITVCGHADESCPALPQGTRKEHWPLPDPAKAAGDEAEVMEVFRASRDEIRQRVVRLLGELAST